MFAEFLNEALIPALYTLALAVVPIVTGFLVDALRKWAKKQKAEWISRLIEEADAAVDRAVDSVEQTFVSKRREAGGKLDARTAREAMNLALSEARKQLGDDALVSLSKALGGTEATNKAMETMAEAAIGWRKTQARSSDEFLNR